MKISELVAALQDHQERNGDVEVVAHNSMQGVLAPINHAFLCYDWAEQQGNQDTAVELSF